MTRTNTSRFDSPLLSKLNSLTIRHLRQGSFLHDWYLYLYIWWHAINDTYITLSLNFPLPFLSIHAYGWFHNPLTLILVFPCIFCTFVLTIDKCRLVWGSTRILLWYRTSPSVKLQLITQKAFFPRFPGLQSYVDVLGRSTPTFFSWYIMNELSGITITWQPTWDNIMK